MSANPSLANILLANLANPDLDIHLSNKEVAYVKEIINENPEILYKISTIMEEITKNTTLKSQDIPKIILSITYVFKLHIVKNLAENISILNLVRFTIGSILDSGIIPLPELELELENIRASVDSSMDLLKMNVEKEKAADYCFSLCPAFCNLKN